MTLMRHGDRICTDENLPGSAAAFDVLPNRTQQAASQFGRRGENRAFPVATRNGIELSERSENTQEKTAGIGQ